MSKWLIWRLASLKSRELWCKDREQNADCSFCHSFTCCTSRTDRSRVGTECAAGRRPCWDKLSSSLQRPLLLCVLFFFPAKLFVLWKPILTALFSAIQCEVMADYSLSLIQFVCGWQTTLIDNWLFFFSVSFSHFFICVGQKQLTLPRL